MRKRARRLWRLCRSCAGYDWRARIAGRGALRVDARTLGAQPDLLDRVAAETEGNAYFIVEVMRALAAERGSLAEVGIGRLPERLLAGRIEQVLGDGCPRSGCRATAAAMGGGG